ncbi:MAG: STAS domain-containing protein [Thermodesulfobacteriota bacterium]|jgi:anti-anti-sigma factor|nr:MAG: STAS domain-containing protein [Thermodesulfobacteriota bacterium]
MLDCTITVESGVTWINLKGRIDSMTSPEIQRQINDLILGGERHLVANLEEINYISSAGLRVFLGAQKQLKKVGGEIIFYKVSSSIFDVFKLGAFDQIFRFASTREEITGALHADKTSFPIRSKEVEKIVFNYLEKKADPGFLKVVGSQENLAWAKYIEKDVVTIKSEELQFGTGLATLGDCYGEYKNLFGEAMVINRNFFFYPAVKRPAVDFMLAANQESSLEYRFLHGFGFTGSYKYVVLFESTEGLVELERLVNAFFSISQANLLGFVILGESKGLWGMHLKNSPIFENQPKNGKEIFDPINFADWVNFPVEAGDINRIIAATGIAIKEVSRERGEVQSLLSKGACFHVHGAVFSQEPLSKKIEQFENELTRVLTELEVYKVQHILGKTRFSSGMVGLVELSS